MKFSLIFKEDDDTPVTEVSIEGFSLSAAEEISVVSKNATLPSKNSDHETKQTSLEEVILILYDTRSSE